MKKTIVKHSLDLWNEDVKVPNVINVSALKGFLSEQFDQVGRDSPDFLNCVFYAWLKYICLKVKKHHGRGRLTPDKIRDVLLDDDVVNIAFGSINVVHENEETHSIQEH